MHEFILAWVFSSQIYLTLQNLARLCPVFNCSSFLGEIFLSSFVEEFDRLRCQRENNMTLASWLASVKIGTGFALCKVIEEAGILRLNDR